MTTTMQVESINSCIDEIKPLFYKHWREIAGNQDTIPLDPDFDRYYNLEDSGVLRIFTARSDGKLVGYFISFIMPHMHHKSTIYGLVDMLYVIPDYRGGTTAYRLIKLAMEDLKSQCKVDILIIHMKIKFEFRRLLTALGFYRAGESWEVLL
jgi:GNAT superfamily N-acetyltransferase